MFGLGVQELLIILSLGVFFFGGKKIPEMARGLGKGLREFRRASDGVADADEERDTPPKEGKPVEAP